ncbi:MAG: F0F1 ATP synthase subunit alpha [Nannocystaceae bacterium]
MGDFAHGDVEAREALVGRLVADGEAHLGELARGLEALRPGARVGRVGRVVSVADGVAVAVGLEDPIAGELVDVDGVIARAEVVSDARVELVILGVGAVEAGAAVRRRGRPLTVAGGESLIGRVVDALGAPLDGGPPIASRRAVVVDGPPIPLGDREPVTRPLRTGVFAVDAMIPIGRGQRQLLIGDRSTGKSELAVDVLAGLDRAVIGVYAAIGRRGAEVTRTLEDLRRAGFFDHGVAVIAEADAPLGQLHLAPATAASIAEDLMLQGRDVVLVLDDLTTHAHAHRSLALLLGRPVGREAYPVDIFYAHARLLERATQLGRRRGGGSLTALPIIETQAGDLAAFIPTNLVSITDGQIRTDAALVAAHHLPAIDVALSVSRVGGKAQPAVIRRLAGRVKTDYAAFLELEGFARFGAQVERATRDTLAWGRRARAFLRQDRGVSLRWSESALRLLLLGHPAIKDVPEDRLSACLDDALTAARARPDLIAALDGGASITDADLEDLRRRIDPIVSGWAARGVEEGAEEEVRSARSSGDAGKDVRKDGSTDAEAASGVADKDVRKDMLSGVEAAGAVAGKEVLKERSYGAAAVGGAAEKDVRKDMSPGDEAAGGASKDAPRDRSSDTDPGGQGG